MTTIKRFFGHIDDLRDEQKVIRRGLVHFRPKRDVWNMNRRFGY